MREDLQELK